MTALLPCAGESTAASRGGQQQSTQELSELEVLSKEVVPRTLKKHARTEDSASRLAGAMASLAAAGAAL